MLCATWGLQQTAVKIANDGIAPLLLVALRSIGGVALLMAWARWRGVALFARDGTLVPGLAAGVLFATEFALIYLGLALTDAARGVLFLYTAPFFVALGAHVFVPGDRLTAIKLAGLAAAFAGLVLALADGLSLPTRDEIAGDLLCLGGAALWGATTVLIKASRLARVSAEKTLFWQLGIAALMLTPLSWLAGESWVVTLTPAVTAAFAFQVVVVGFASYTAWFWLVRRYPASLLSAFTFLTPVFGVAFGALLLGERVGPLLLAALALIALGVWLVNRPASRAALRG